MIEFDKVEVMNLDGAIRGIRNSYESHTKSDSEWVDFDIFNLGQADKKLAMNLVKAGASHAKFMRQILVCVDINAPLYWWKEFDQYKVGTVTNSESTMHTIQKHEMVPSEELFSLDIPKDIDLRLIEPIFGTLEFLRNKFLETKDRKYWKLLIQLLPSGWMQKRTTTLNYAVIANAYWDRKSHRLTEWHDFCNWAKTLPYSELITGEEN